MSSLTQEIAVVTNLEAAAPFLLTALVTLVGGVFSLGVLTRAEQAYEEIVGKYEASLNEQIVDKYQAYLEKKALTRAPKLRVTQNNRTTGIKPESLAGLGNWLIDGGALLVSLTGPAIGLAFLYDRFGSIIFFSYAVVLFLILLGYGLFVWRVPPSGYPGQPLLELRRRRPRIRVAKVWIFTPIVMFTVIVNLAAGVLVLIIGP